MEKEKKETLKLGFSDGILPAFYQVGLLCLVILGFYFFIDKKSTILISPINSSINNDPNLVRFVYMFFALVLGFGLLFWSSKIESIKKSFWLSLIAGLLFWQAVGECSWHFCLYENNISIYFPKIEGIQGTFILILLTPLITYIIFKRKLPWFLEVVVLTFMLNWIGHFVMIGVGAWFSGGSEEILFSWFKMIGIVIGGSGIIYVIYYLLFKNTSINQRLRLSIFLYTFVIMFIEGVFQISQMFA